MPRTLNRPTWGPPFSYPTWNAILTWGAWLGGPAGGGASGAGQPGQPPQGNRVGPSGPFPDPRGGRYLVGPWIGRAVMPLNAWQALPPFPLFAWPQKPVNNSYAGPPPAMYVPGWIKQAPTPTDGF